MLLLGVLCVFVLIQMETGNRKTAHVPLEIVCLNQLCNMLHNTAVCVWFFFLKKHSEYNKALSLQHGIPFFKLNVLPLNRHPQQRRLKSVGKHLNFLSGWAPGIVNPPCFVECVVCVTHQERSPCLGLQKWAAAYWNRQMQSLNARIEQKSNFSSFLGEKSGIEM